MIFEKNQYNFWTTQYLAKQFKLIKKLGDIQLLTNERKRNRLASSVNLTGSKYVLDFFKYLK